MTIWLIGMMGTGKTTAGSLAANLLGVEYIDIDDEIEYEAQRPIADIWRHQGEGRFREMESAALRRVAGNPAVVGTGGGAALSPVNRELMGSTGKVIWLEADPAVLSARIGRDTSRPLLEGVDDLERHLRSLADERRDAYSSIAGTQIDTSDLTPLEVAERISKA